MANIVVTSTTNTILVDFGVYSTSLGISKAVWQKVDVRFELKDGNTFVNVLVNQKPSFAVSFDGSTNTLQVDTVGGVAPTSNSDLYDKLTTLIA